VCAAFQRLQRLLLRGSAKALVRAVAVAGGWVPLPKTSVAAVVATAVIIVAGLGGVDAAVAAVVVVVSKTAAR